MYVYVYLNTYYYSVRYVVWLVYVYTCCHRATPWWHQGSTFVVQPRTSARPSSTAL